MLESLARSTVLSGLKQLQHGTLALVEGGQTRRFGQAGGAAGQSGVDATMTVQAPRFYRRVVLGGDIGLGESYMDGDWTSPDLVTLTRLLIRNAGLVESRGSLARAATRVGALVSRRLRDNTVRGSRRHIHEHYDLGNDFFRLFLDEDLQYSSAYFQTGRETLEQAQQQKLDRICRKLALGPGDHLLEIGTGWGGLAVWAATRYGCRVTTTTISDEQYRCARERAARLGEAASRVTVLRSDYRELTGRFDKIVSIEMFEAVGLRHYDEFFSAVHRLLHPDGVMLLQAITVDDQRFPAYHRQADWIEKYIFPGGELASIGEVLRSLQRVTSLSLYHAENFGSHYARTLHEWRLRFRRQLDRVRLMGFGDRFIRMWDLYLAFCEAAFLERHTGVFQLLLTRNYSQSLHFNEPWAQPAADASAVA